MLYTGTQLALFEDEKMGRDKVEQKSKFVLPRPKEVRADGVADWGNCDAKIVMHLISVITSKGGAVRFGYTRDGGAYSLGLYLADDRATHYWRPGEDIDANLSDLVADLENLDLPTPKKGG